MVLPKSFGKYDVVGVLGAGAMGTVYDGLDPIIGRRVAIKTVVKHSLDASEAQEMLDRFKQEAQAAGRLNHPGVCAIYDYGETDYVAYIAMEYISGKELKSYFDEGVKLDLKEIVRIMTEILEALDHAHRNKVVHRDIKPANIMITEDNRVKVADFGVAKLESSMLTQVGTKVGTPAYMSPEQHKGLAVDGRSDLFSCGVILYQFLTGARPFAGGSQTVAREIMNSTPRLPSEINTSLSPIWDAIANKALAKRRDQRFPTAREFIDALAQALQQSPEGAGLPSSASQNPTTGKTGNTGRSAIESVSGQADRSHLAMESELEFWKEIKDSDVAEDFAAFVDSFPQGRFSHLARRRLEKLRGSPATPSPTGGPSLATPGGSPAIALTNVPSEGGVSEDQTQLSSSSAKVVVVEEKVGTPPPAMEAPVALKGQGTDDVDATLVQSKAGAAPDEDVEATLVQGRERNEGDGSVSEEAFPDESSAEVIDLDLLDGAGSGAITGASPIGSVVASSSTPPETFVSAAQKAATVSTQAPVAEVRSPAVSPINASATKSTVEKEAASVGSDSSSSASVGPSAAERAALIGVAPALSPVSSRGQEEASVSAAVPVPAPEVKVQIASMGAPTEPLPPSTTTRVDELAVPAKKSPVAVIAGLVIALAAGGAWLAFGPGSSPPATGPATASRDAIPGKGQDVSGSSGASTSAQDVSRSTSATRQDNAKIGETEKGIKGPDQKRAERPVDEKVAAKGAGDGPSSGMQAEEKTALDRRAAERSVADRAAERASTERAAAEKAIADKAVSDKLAADRAAADRAAADRAAADRAAADKAAADKAAADKAAADRAAADKAAADKAAADKAAAATASAAGSIADRIAAASAPAELYKRAVALRSEGKTSQAVPLLRQASSQGHGPSSRLLVVIFTDGSGDVRANFREAERYKEIADKQGDR